VGYQNATLWVPNIGPITSPREGFGGKSPLFEFILLTITTPHPQEILVQICLQWTVGLPTFISNIHLISFWWM